MPYSRWRDSDNIVARINLPNMRHEQHKRVEVFAAAIKCLITLEQDPEKRLKYTDFIGISTMRSTPSLPPSAVCGRWRHRLMRLDFKQTAFGRHETFPLRYAWLTKGFGAVERQPDLFRHAHQAMVRLGVGRNMVSAIQF